MFSQEYGTGKYTTECTMACTMVCQSDAMDSPIFISILDSGFFLVSYSVLDQDGVEMWIHDGKQDSIIN